VLPGLLYKDIQMTFRPYNQITASGVSDERTNNSGVTMQKGTPARVNGAGELDFVDIAVEAEALATVGVIAQTIGSGSQGSFLTSGKVENISTSALFGDMVYINKTGAITNIKPSAGVNGFVSGDFVVQIGVIAKNESNPLLKDLIISVVVVGQL
jgi:hypothetical protein